MRTGSAFFPLNSLGRAKWLAVSLLALIAALSPGLAEDHADGSSPERVIRDFYQWYVQALVSNRDPFVKGRAELKRFATERLIKQIDRARKGPDGLDGDYFVDAQDFDNEWAKNITVSTPVIKDKHATVEVELKGSEVGTRNLLIDLVWDGGRWKLDKVEGQ
jgi:Protein of unknown function (DUF3828)